jgi:hypothetical protein
MKIFKDKKLKETIILNRESKVLYQRELVQRSRAEIKLKMSKLLSNHKQVEIDQQSSPRSPKRTDLSVSKTIDPSRLDKSPEFLIKSNHFTFKGLKRNNYSFKSNYYGELEKSMVKGPIVEVTSKHPRQAAKYVDLQIIKQVSIPNM